MGRQAEAPCPPWGSRRRPAALLAAAILSSCFLLTQAKEISVRMEPSQPLQGQDVTLSPEGNTSFVQCNWYRGARAEAYLILTYVPAFSPPEIKGPFFTGRETVNRNCSLHISNLILNDSGIYSVSKTVSGGLDTGSITITVSELLTKPNVSAFPTPFPIESIGSVTLTCETIPGEVSVSWFYNGELLSGSSRIQLSEDNRTVVIRDANRNDTGEYQCYVTNPVSTNISDNFFITVIYGPDTPTIEPTQHSYNQNSDIRISCYADTFPDAHYIWSLDGKELKKTSDFLIHAATPEDSGSYVCKAWNVLSHHESYATLDIEVAGNVSNVSISGPSSAVEYQTVQLNCTSLGSLVSYYWFKDNQLVEAGGRVILSDKNKSLTFTVTIRNDTASYICQGFNNFSSQASEPHWLDIFYGPDIPIIDPQESVYNEGSTLNLSCFADSNPSANYSWRHNDHLLENQTDSQLLIQTLSVSDAGNYTCLATNDKTKISNFTILEITILEKVTDITITSHPDQAIEHKRIVLDCRSAGSSVSYTWSKGDQILSSGGHITLGYSNLTFNPVSRNDTGNYTCSGSNSFSKSNATYQLEVVYGPDELIISPPRHDYGEGSVLTLICHADSHPPAQYTWSFNETELPEKGPQLSRANLSYDQAGTYTCNASNPVTNFSTSTPWKIRVLENVSHVSIQGLPETTENSSLTLICSSSGSEVFYTWFKENQSLEDSGGHISVLGLNHESLTLNPVNRSDSGFYTCRGNNTVSEASSGLFLLDVFYGPDDPIINLTEHDYIESSELSISCQAASNPPSNYTWFFDANNETKEIGKSSQLLIHILSFDKAGDYTCKATNVKTNISRTAVWEIRVQEKLIPPTLLPWDSLVVKEHMNATLNCTTSASDRVFIFWFKNGESLPAKSILSEKNRTLTIPDISRDDEGTYTCQAWNPANNATSNPSKIVVESVSSPDPGLSAGAIVGIVIGCLVGVVLIVTVVYFALKSTTLGRMEQHSSNGNIPSAPGRNQGVTDTKPTAGEEDIQYTTLAFGSNSPSQPSLGPNIPLESSTIYSVIKKK